MKSKNLLVPAGDPKHILIVSNDGIPQEFDAIRKGEIDATVSQPAAPLVTRENVDDKSLWGNQIGK